MRNIKSNSSIKNARRLLFSLAAVLILLFCVPGSDANAQTTQPANRQDKPLPDHDHSQMNDRARNPTGVSRIAIPDVDAVDQDGNPLHFYSDLIKGKVVIVNFIFTSCTYICPLQGANFSRIQTALGDRLGKDVSLVSVSVDPITDTPQRLRAWGEKFGRKAGWTFVTGKKTEIDRLLRALTGDPSGVKEHSAIAFIGSYDLGVWVRADALEDPARLIEALDNAIGQKLNQAR